MRSSLLVRLASLLATGAVAVAAAAAPVVARAQFTTVALVRDSANGTLAPSSVARTTSSGAWNGVYRVQLALSGKDAAPAALVVERAADVPSGFMLVDVRGAPLSAIRIDGDTLRARVATAEGVGDLTLRIDGDRVIGTLQVGRHRWDVTGQKTV